MTLTTALTLPLWALALLFLAALALLAAEFLTLWTLLLAPLVAQWRVWRMR